MRKAKFDSEWILFQVMTIPEICEIWKKDRKVVLYNVDTGRFTARKSGMTWLVSVQSVIKWWGYPPGNGHSVNSVNTENKRATL